MNIPILGSMGVTAVTSATSITAAADDSEEAAALAVKSATTLSTGSVLLYNGYRDVKFDIELTKRYIESLSDDELYQLEQKLTAKEENIVIEETHSKSI